MRRRPSKPPSYLMSMLDLLSGAFACSAVIFVIFATLMGADMAVEHAFMHVEGRLLTTSGESASDSFQIALRVDPDVPNTQGLHMSTEFPTGDWQSEDEFAPSGSRIEFPAPGSEDDLLSTGPVALPMIAGATVAPNGTTTDDATASLFARGSGQFVVSLSVLRTQRSALRAITGAPAKGVVRLELVVHHSDIEGGVRVVHVERQLSIADLVKAINASRTEFASSHGVPVGTAARLLDRFEGPHQLHRSTSAIVLQCFVRVGSRN